MATTDQKANYLYKQSLSVATTSDARKFYEEPYRTSRVVLPSEIWADESLIPVPAAVLADLAVDPSGTTQYFYKHALTPVTGTTNSFYHADLKNSIPFNYTADGTYNVKVYKADTVTVVPFGQGDWVIDNGSGVMTFFTTVPSGLPPVVSWYKYVGALGGVVTGGGLNSVNFVTNPGGNIDIIAGSNTLVTPDNLLKHITIDALTNTQEVSDIIGAVAVAGSGINLVYSSLLQTLTISATAGGSPGDILETSFVGSQGIIVPSAVTGFTFSPVSVRSFNATVSVSVSATTSLYETFTVTGINVDGAFQGLPYFAVGDNSGVFFSITSGGQINYISDTYAGFGGLVIKFRATVLSV